MKKKSPLLKIFGGTVAVAFLFMAFMGFAHTKAGRPALMFLGKLVGKKEFCPLGYDKHATAAERIQSRALAAAQRSDKPAAVKRAALSFVLGETTRDQIRGWAKSQNGECRDLTSEFEVECVGAFFHSDSSTLWLEFNLGNQLVSARGIEMFKRPDAAWDFFAKMREDLRAQGAHGAVEAGAKDQGELKPLLSQASIIADFKDYSATVRVGNMGPSGYALTHEFRSF